MNILNRVLRERSKTHVISFPISQLNRKQFIIDNLQGHMANHNIVSLHKYYYHFMSYWGSDYIEAINLSKKSDYPCAIFVGLKLIENYDWSPNIWGLGSNFSPDIKVHTNYKPIGYTLGSGLDGHYEYGITCEPLYETVLMTWKENYFNYNKPF